MSIELILFIVFGSVCAVTAVLVIIRINPVISALFLVVNFASLAGLYLILNAQFIAIAQIIVYAGAIMVFFLFVIMLLNPESEKKFFSHKPFIKIFTVIVVALVFIQIIYMIFLAQPSEEITKEAATSLNAGTIEQIGKLLFTNYVLPFEAAGYLLLAATIGALVIAKKKFE